MAVVAGLRVTVLLLLVHAAPTTPSQPATASLAVQLTTHLGSRCDLQVLPCSAAGDAATAISQRLRSSAAEALLLRNCSDASVFPLHPSTWAELQKLGSMRLLLTTQRGSRSQLGPALAEAGPQAVCGTGSSDDPLGYRGYCERSSRSSIADAELHDYISDMGSYLPAWAFYGPEGLVPSGADALCETPTHHSLIPDCEFLLKRPLLALFSIENAPIPHEIATSVTDCLCFQGARLTTTAALRCMLRRAGLSAAGGSGSTCFR